MQEDVCASHTVRLHRGRLEAFGANKFGQLCTPSALATEHVIVAAEDIVAFAAGGAASSGHTLFATGRGVFSCGCDRWQQLGLSKAGGAAGYTWEAGATSQREPRRLPFFDGQHVVDLAAGDDHSVALLASGEVFSWGRGHCGQLGRPRQFVSTPALATDFSEGNAKAIAAAGNCTCAYLETRAGGYPVCAGRCSAVEAELHKALHAKVNRVTVR